MTVLRPNIDRIDDADWDPIDWIDDEPGDVIDAAALQPGAA